MLMSVLLFVSAVTMSLAQNTTEGISEAEVNFSKVTVKDPNSTIFLGVPGPVHNLDTRENFETIQAAIDASNTTHGHAITVDARTYYENVNVYKRLTIRSTSKNPVDTIVNVANPDFHVFEVTSDYVNISGLKLEGGFSGIYLNSSNNCKISNNNLSNNMRGIYLEDSNSNIISHNNVSKNGDGIYLLVSRNNLIFNNYFENTNNAWDDRTNTWNITKVEGKNIIGGSYLGGNYWSDYRGSDTEGDGLGNTFLPYNSSGNISTGGDMHPFFEPGHNVNLFVDVNAQTVSPDKNATYNLTIQNTGNVVDSFELLIDNLNGATVANLNGTSIKYLAPGATQNVLLNVTDEAQGTYIINVTATSEGGGVDVRDTASTMTTVKVEPTYGVSLSQQTEQTTMPNVNATYKITVTNTGNQIGNFTLELNNITDDPAVAYLSTNLIENLNGGANMTVFLNVTDETPRIYNVSVTAVLLGNESVNDTITLVTTVSPINITAFNVEDGALANSINANVTIKNDGDAVINVTLVVSGGEKVSGYPLAGTGVIANLGPGMSVTLPMLVYVPIGTDTGIYDLYADAWIEEDYPDMSKMVYFGPKVANVTSS